MFGLSSSVGLGWVPASIQQPMRESVRCVIPVIACFSSENLLVPWKSCSRTAPFQRPPTIRAVVSTGQISGRLAMRILLHIVYHVLSGCHVFACNRNCPFFIYLNH